MDDTTKLESLSVEELRLELIARKAHRQRIEAESGISVEQGHAPLPMAIAQYVGLGEIDSATLEDVLERKLHAIYGEDGRRDFYDPLMDETIRDAADGVLGIFADHRVSDNHDGTSTLVLESYMAVYRLCGGEFFSDQPLGPLHTGFLVAPDIVATVGSLLTESNMHLRRFVFGFRMKNATEWNQVVKTSDVYSAVEMIERKSDPNGADWALVRLDRPVTDRPTLPIRRSGELNTQFVHIIGHPCGLPLKYAMNGRIRAKPPSPVFVNTVTAYNGYTTEYSGNKGSPVFDSATDVVEGIHCRGEIDFDFDPDPRRKCNVSHRYGEDGGNGNEATRTTEFADRLANYAPFSLNTYGFLYGNSGDFAFATTPAPNGDLFVIGKVPLATGYLPLRIFEASRKYQNYTGYETALKHESGDRWTFAVASNRDLFAIKMQNCGSSRTEVHVLSAASNYKSFAFQRSTPIEMTDENWTYGVTNIRDVIAIRKKNGATKSTEVHLLSSASDYQEFSYQGGSVLPETDASWDFAITASDDFYAIRRSGGASRSTEISILRFSDRWKSIARTTGSVLHPTDATWSFAVLPNGNLIAMQQPTPYQGYFDRFIVSQMRAIDMG